MELRRAPAGPNVITFPTSTGDFVRFQLKGGGGAGLIVIDEGDDGVIDLVMVCKATAKNVLQVTLVPNGGLGVIDVGEILVQGSIGAINAPAMVPTEVTVTGRLGKLIALELASSTVTVGMPAGCKFRRSS